jgi:hypothetical protein
MQNRSKFFTRTIQYVGTEYMDDRLTKVMPVGTLDVYKDGKAVGALSRTTDLSFAQIERETTPGMFPPRMSETRDKLIADGYIAPWTDYPRCKGEPYLPLTEDDMIRAERILAGLDSGELDLIMEASEDADTEMGAGP